MTDYNRLVYVCAIRNIRSTEVYRFAKYSVSKMDYSAYICTARSQLAYSFSPTKYSVQ
jgi:hypothetical protein